MPRRRTRATTAVTDEDGDSVECDSSHGGRGQWRWHGDGRGQRRAIVADEGGNTMECDGGKSGRRRGKSAGMAVAGLTTIPDSGRKWGDMDTSGSEHVTSKSVRIHPLFNFLRYCQNGRLICCRAQPIGHLIIHPLVYQSIYLSFFLMGCVVDHRSWLSHIIFRFYPIY